MMPRFISAKSSPPGELEVFHLLQESKLTEDWFVLHSLDLANHTNQISGEADFVIIAPGHGVLVLEVKSHKFVKYERGEWWLGTNAEPESRGPFKQASAAKHSLIKYASNNTSDLGGSLFASAACFSHANFKQRSPEWHDWQAIDKDLLGRMDIGEIVSSILDKAHKHAADKNIHLKIPDVEHAKKLANLLRPSFEAIPSAKAIRAELKAELVKCTEEQFHALDAMADNPRNLFTGPAGCGKTTLAIEIARRAHETGEGEHTLFLCFNKLLHETIRKEVKEKAPDVTFATFGSFLLNQTGLKPKEKDFGDPAFWNETLPETALGMQLDNQLKTFRYLILDEAQDLFRTNYLEVLDLLLDKGFRDSQWNIFGDFTNQDIFSNGEVNIDDFKRKWAPGLASFKLMINCRNTIDISCYVESLGRMDPPYSKTLRKGEQEPKLTLYKDLNDESAKVKECIEHLMQQGIRTQDIVILHSQKDTCPVVESLNKDPQWQIKVHPYAIGQSGLRHCSIQKFKGLESMAVIIADFDELRNDYQVSLFYIGLSRALSNLHIFAHEDLKQTILEHL